MRSTHKSQHYIGAVLWILSIQYYVAQFVVAASWPKYGRYSWAHNTISDLANTHCGIYDSKMVCSPLHTTMNISFIVLGITMVSGTLVLRKQLANSYLTNLGFIFIVLGGIGTVLVGLFPENTVLAMHIIGAALPFVFGNLGMIALGASLKRLPVWLRSYSVISGVIGLLALGFFTTSTYLGIGLGGMERIVSYPLTIWMIGLGLYLLLSPKPASFTD